MPVALCRKDETYRTETETLRALPRSMFMNLRRGLQGPAAGVTSNELLN